MSFCFVQHWDSSAHKFSQFVGFVHKIHPVVIYRRVTRVIITSHWHNTQRRRTWASRRACVVHKSDVVDCVGTPGLVRRGRVGTARRYNKSTTNRSNGVALTVVAGNETATILLPGTVIIVADFGDYRLLISVHEALGHGVRSQSSSNSSVFIIPVSKNLLRRAKNNCLVLPRASYAYGDDQIGRTIR